MRTIALERGLDLTARAASNLDLDSRIADARVLLVGPHLAASFPELKAAAAGLSIPAALLPSTAFGPTGALEALELALSLLKATPEGSTHA